MRHTFFLGITLSSFLLCLIVSKPSPAYAITSEQTAENTKPPIQITNRKELKIVVQVNSAATIPNGVSKQVFAVKNLHDQYAALGMKSGIDYEVVVVFRGDGSQFLLSDDAYDLKVKEPHPSGNPNKALLDALHQDGFKMYECGVAMQLKGYKATDILPYSGVVVSGIGAIIDFEKSGYLTITP